MLLKDENNEFEISEGTFLMIYDEFIKLISSNYDSLYEINCGINGCCDGLGDNEFSKIVRNKFIKFENNFKEQAKRILEKEVKIKKCSVKFQNLLSKILSDFINFYVSKKINVEKVKINGYT